MTADQRPLLPEIFADAILDLHAEGGVFRLTLAQSVPQREPDDGTRNVLVPKATLLLTEQGFGSLCELVEHVHSQISETEHDGHGSSPNFE